MLICLEELGDGKGRGGDGGWEGRKLLQSLLVVCLAVIIDDSHLIVLINIYVKYINY